MGKLHKPAECFPLGHFIAEELEARGWSERHLAEQMVGKDGVDVNALTVKLLIHAMPKRPEMIVGNDTFAAIASALQLDECVLRRLDTAWRTWKAAEATVL